MSVVKPYKRLYQSLVTIDDIDFNPSKIPEELTLIANAIDKETEEKLINLINTPSSKRELITIMNCLAKEFENDLGCKLNDKSVGILKPGQEMREMQDLKYYNPCMVVMNLGSHTVLILRNKKDRSVYTIPLPRRSMFLYKDPKDLFERIIDKRTEDFVGTKKLVRDVRYSVVFKSKK